MPSGATRSLPLKMTSSIDVAAQVLRALLAQHPADGVDDVRLAAAVRPDDAGDAAREIENRTLGEGLEAD